MPYWAKIRALADGRLHMLTLQIRPTYYILGILPPAKTKTFGAAHPAHASVFAPMGGFQLLCIQKRKGIIMAIEKQTCDIAINYSEIIGEKVFPFLISLDLTRSVMIPASGQNQRFCYNVTGIGSKIAADADLDCLVLGMRGDISESLFAEICVEIDGTPQQVYFGESGNVCLATAKDVGLPAGYTGLKFTFPLKRAGGVMRLCYELTSPYPVGDNPVYLFGSGASVSGLCICGPVFDELPESKDNTSLAQPTAGELQAFAAYDACEPPPHTFEPSHTCETVGYQPARLNVPVTVTPCVRAKTPVTVRCGSPIVTPCDPGHNSCSFVITQKVCVAVPVEIGASANIGKVSVKFEDADGERALNDCLYSITLK